MSTPPLTRFSLLAVALTLLCVGCSEEKTTQTVQDDVQLMPAMPGTPIDVDAVSNTRYSSPKALFAQGEQFYFHKKIEQTLEAQPGSPVGAVSEIVELLLSITVDEVMPDRVHWKVAFHNVLYQSTLGGKRLRYDSRSRAEVPTEALPYHGLVNNGFTLIVDHHNNLLDVEGFPAFLQHCIAGYPETVQPGLLQQLGAHAVEPRERIASAISFLDESVGLLPFNELNEKQEAFPVGASWSRIFSRSQSIPVEQSIRANIEHISGDGEAAHILIKGEMRPLNPQGTLSVNAIRARVIAGEVTGSCSVSLRTGLPKICRIQRHFTLELASLSQAPVTTRKTVVTSFEAWTPPVNR